MHPAETDLALYAGGELSWWRRLLLARHLRRCPLCRQRADEFKQCRQWLHQQQMLPAGVNWDILAAEMRANIRLGLAAGECVRAHGEQRWNWRPAALALPVLILVVAGWLLQLWRPAPWRGSLARDPVIEATAAGVELRRGGAVLTLLHPQAAEVGRLASGDAVRVRYVDAETGLVTISHVYAH